jgi:hypothetical protein
MKHGKLTIDGFTRDEALFTMLLGLGARRKQLDIQMAAINQELDGKATAPTPAKPKRKVSAAGRRRMKEAQQARWAKFRAQQQKQKKRAAV